LAAALQTAIEKISVCRICGNIDTQNPCTLCTDPRRDDSTIVVVADVADLWALERAHAINARYHVLGGILSPLDGVGPDDLSIDALMKRMSEPAIKEVILALSATVEGQSTAHYITDLLRETKVKVTRLAHGVPVGGELDYLDEGTLAAACNLIRARLRSHHLFGGVCTKTPGSSLARFAGGRRFVDLRPGPGPSPIGPTFA